MEAHVLVGWRRLAFLALLVPAFLGCEPGPGSPGASEGAASRGEAALGRVEEVLPPGYTLSGALTGGGSNGWGATVNYGNWRGREAEIVTDYLFPNIRDSRWRLIQYGGSNDVAKTPRGGAIAAGVTMVWSLGLVPSSGPESSWGSLAAAARGDYTTDTTLAYTLSGATDVFSARGHGLRDGMMLVFPAGAPAGITPEKNYHVRDATADTFKLTTAYNGAAVDLPNNGAGSVLVTSLFTQAGRDLVA